MLAVLEQFVGPKTAKGIADGVVGAVRDGAIESGEKLPPIRDVAVALQVSPSTVAAAWAILSRAGVVHSDGRRGTKVSSQRRLGPERTRRVLTYATRFAVDLSTGLPEPALLPDLKAALTDLSGLAALHSYLDEPVLPDLLEELHHTWPSTADVITIADGAQDALDLIATSFIRFGDKVAVEELSDANLIDVLEFVGAKLVPIALDTSGAVPASLEDALDGGARWVFLQPRAHHPTGITWTAKRRDELAAVLLRHPGATAVEVDFSGAVASTKLHSLGSKAPSQTIHIRAYSASHGPELRIAAIGGPVEPMEALLQRRHVGQGWTSRILQSILLSMLHSPGAVAAVEAARAEYAGRRQRLIAELAANGVKAQGGDGLHVYVPVHNESSALVALASQSIGVAPGTPYSVDGDAEPHIVVTVAALEDAQVPSIAAVLAAAASPRQIASSGARARRPAPR